MAGLFSLLIAVCITITIQGQASQTSIKVDQSRLEKYLVDNFSRGRSYLQPEEHTRVRGIIENFFNAAKENLPVGTSANLHESVTTIDDQETDMISYYLEIPGSNSGSFNDKPVLVGAHYDSQINTPGVDDNGSGMAALFEILTLLQDAFQDAQCQFANTVFIAAFDYEEFGLLGSKEFVSAKFVPILEERNIPPENFQGAYILETIMNHNTTPNSQIVFPGLQLAYPDVYRILEANQFRGDFLSVIHRNDDVEMANLLTNMYAQVTGESDTLTGDYKLMALPANFQGRPSDLPKPIQTVLRDLFRSDHYAFWNSPSNYTEKGLKALFITDTANFRGNMIECYHNPCDNLDAITPEQIEFLATSTEAVFLSTVSMATDDPKISCIAGSGTQIISSRLAIFIGLLAQVFMEILIKV